MATPSPPRIRVPGPGGARPVRSREKSTPIRRTTYQQHRLRVPVRKGAKPRTPRPRRWRRWLAAAVGVVAVFSIGVLLYAWYEWNQVPHPPELGLLPPPENIETILIAGSDTRQGIEGQEFGGEAVGGQRADTLMILVLPPGHAKSTMVAIPRDLRVDIPGRGVGKINAALNSGAADLVQATQNALGLTVNHYVEVNFDGFRDLSTALGGVPVCVDYPIRDAFSLLDLGAGCHNLEGDAALAWVRSRHAEFFIEGEWVPDPQSDLSRIQRQQQFMQNMLKKMASPFNLLRVTKIADAAKKSFTVDEQFSFWHLLRLALRFVPSPAARLNYATLPVEGERIGGVDYLVPVQPEADALLGALRAGEEPPPDSVTDPQQAAQKE